MNDVTEYYRDIREFKQEKRRLNRTFAAVKLTELGIAFESKNDGAHFVIASPKGTIDFWPGTGLWIVRNVQGRKRGIQHLLKYLAPKE